MILQYFTLFDWFLDLITVIFYAEGGKDKYFENRYEKWCRLKEPLFRQKFKKKNISTTRLFGV